MPSVTHPLQAASLSGHDAFVEGVEFSSNGKYIMSSSSGELIQYYAYHCVFSIAAKKRIFPNVYLVLSKNLVRFKRRCFNSSVNRVYVAFCAREKARKQA